jgi:hypothetical protein
MPAAVADRNLLFGILALQMDFISRDALIAGLHAWVLDKDKPLGHILRDQGCLSAERWQLLETLVQEHLKSDHDDPQRSLAALPAAPSVSRQLQGIADEDLEARLFLAIPFPGLSDTFSGGNGYWRRSTGRRS